MIIPYAALTQSDDDQAQGEQTATLLINYGFDNRNIAAVYIPEQARAIETANMLIEIGVFSKNKLKNDQRLVETITDNDARQSVQNFYNEIEKAHPQGHVIVITSPAIAKVFIETLTKNTVKAETAQPYLIPIAQA
jgi:broad specificity phosphatase PhoE